MFNHQDVTGISPTSISIGTHQGLVLQGTTIFGNLLKSVMPHTDLGHERSQCLDMPKYATQYVFELKI